MSNTSNKTLSDLFSAARAEEPVEFVSQQEAARLVSNGIMHDVPQSMWQRVNTHLLSTPLRLSITAMTSAAIITIGILAVRSLTDGTPAITSQPQIAQVQHQQSHNKVVIDTDFKQASTQVKPVIGIKTPTAVVALPAPTVSATPVVPAIPAVPVVEATPAQLEALGISLDDSGGIVCQFPREEIRFDLNGTMRFEAGMIPRDSSTIWKEPHLVTSPSGSKRFFSYVSFSKDTAIEKIGGNGKKMNFRVSVEERMVVSNDSEASAMAVNHHKTNGTISAYGSHARVNVKVDSSLHRGEVRVQLPSSAKIEMIDPSRAVFHYDSGAPEEDLGQTLIGPGSNTRIVLDPDSTQIEPLIKAIAVLVKKDSVLHHATTNTVIAQIEKDSAVLLVKRLGDELAKKNQAEADSANEDQAQLIFQQVASDLNHQASIAPNFDNLIPILVRNTKNSEHPNELILWYEPTQQMTNLLPAAKQSSHEVKAKSFEVSVYPNPTNGPATLNYTFKQGASVTFTLRNLLGQMVMEIGNANGSAGTTGNLSFDLSKLDAGLYLLVTTTDDGEQSVERIVVNK